MTFQKGQSGNPAGRPPGARGKATLFAEALSAGDAQEIVRTAIDKAKQGDMAAVRFCLDRIALAGARTTVTVYLICLACTFFGETWNKCAVTVMPVVARLRTH